MLVRRLARGGGWAAGIVLAGSLRKRLQFGLHRDTPSLATA